MRRNGGLSEGQAQDYIRTLGQKMGSDSRQWREGDVGAFDVPPRRRPRSPHSPMQSEGDAKMRAASPSEEGDAPRRTPMTPSQPEDDQRDAEMAAERHTPRSPSPEDGMMYSPRSPSPADVAGDGDFLKLDEVLGGMGGDEDTGKGFELPEYLLPKEERDRRMQVQIPSP